MPIGTLDFNKTVFSSAFNPFAGWALPRFVVSFVELYGMLSCVWSCTKSETSSIVVAIS